MSVRPRVTRLALLLVGLGWLALAHPQAQTAPVIAWTHAGTNVTHFQIVIGTAETWVVDAGLPTPSGTTYEYALPALPAGQWQVKVRACYGADCQDSAAMTVVKMVPEGATALNYYWVSPTGEAANWAACKSDTPLDGASACTLATALSNVAAGQTAWLRGGTYNRGILMGSSRDGTLADRITFAAHPNETPIIDNTTTYVYTGRYHALLLQYSDYWVLRGITFSHNTAQGYFAQIVKDSNHIEISHCVFNGGGVKGLIEVWKGDAALDDTNASTHVWIHDSTFVSAGAISDCNDLGGIQIGMYASPLDQVSGNATLENTTLFIGGHHNLETFSKYNVLRNLSFHNEGSMSSDPCTYGPDSNALYGNRNIQLYDGGSQDGMFNLVEGNRFGPSGPPPDDDGGDGLTVTAPKNIIRLNEVYGAQNNGVLFKTGSGSLADNNRFYHNTVYGSGRYQNTGPQWQGGNFRWYSGYTRTGNVLSNNVFYGYGTGGSDWTGSVAANDATNTISNNLCTDAADRCGVSGDPKFVSTTYNAFAFSMTAPNLTIQSDSPAKDAAISLTTVNDADGCTAASEDCTSLVVADALMFQDGTWGSDLTRTAGTLKADWIAIGTVSNVAQIQSINYATNTITLASEVSWANGDGVWLYKDSYGRVVLIGTAPDIGAHEYGIGAAAAPTNVRIR